MIDEAEPEGGLGLEGERTVSWVVQRWRDGGVTPLVAHDSWLRSSSVPAGDRSAHEHHVLCVLLHAMLVVDQLNVAALQSAELVARRLQLIEDACRVHKCPSPRCSSRQVRSISRGPAGTAHVSGKPKWTTHP